MLIFIQSAGSRWEDYAAAAALDLAAATMLRQVAVNLRKGYKQAGSMAVAYLCCAAAMLLVGSSSLVGSLQSVLVMASTAAAVPLGMTLLSAVLLAMATADWLAGAVLLAVPLALLASQGDGGRSKQAAGLLRRLAAYSLCWVATAAALPHLAPLLPLPLDRWLRLPAAAAPLPWHSRQQLQDTQADALSWVGTRAGQQPAYQKPALLLPASSLQPGLGLHWYLLAQAFPPFRAFFLYVLDVLPAATMLPLALRFPHQPALLLAAGALLRCLLHPCPHLGCIALCLAFLPLAHIQLQGVVGLPWMALGMAAAALLCDASAQLWLGSGAGNANFLYGMNLLWAALQVVLLLQLLRAGARQEAGSSSQAEVAAAASQDAAPAASEKTPA